MASPLSPGFWVDPFFWAFLSMIGWASSISVVGNKILGKNTWFGIIVVALAEIPRLILPLDFIMQPRFGGSSLFLALGGLVLIIALIFGSPVFRIQPFTKPQKKEPLRTMSLYAVVRHPLYVCDILWPLGVALLFRSVIGTVLTVVWFLVAAQLALFEEEQLIEAYGDEYRAYQRKVKWRLIPYLF
ncbi:MAG TPA: isoprenylcysteine carboxylmethyltransferase family protein [Ktedonobacteraceae bacterium]